jgi:hypothetical protein
MSITSTPASASVIGGMGNTAPGAKGEQKGNLAY